MPINKLCQLHDLGLRDNLILGQVIAKCHLPMLFPESMQGWYDLIPLNGTPGGWRSSMDSYPVIEMTMAPKQPPWPTCFTMADPAMAWQALERLFGPQSGPRSQVHGQGSQPSRTCLTMADPEMVWNALETANPQSSALGPHLLDSGRPGDCVEHAGGLVGARGPWSGVAEVAHKADNVP